MRPAALPWARGAVQGPNVAPSPLRRKRFATAVPAPLRPRCDFWNVYAHVLLVLFLARVFDLTRIFSLAPPPDVALVSTGDGDPTTQIVTLAMAAAALPLAVRNKDAVWAALIGLWPVLLLLAWCWLSVSWAIVPEISMRRIALSSLVVWILYGALAELRTPAAVMRTLMAVTAAMIVADYVVLAVLPTAAIWHGTDVQGIHASKNDAGAAAMMAALAWTAGFIAVRRPVARIGCVAMILAATGFLQMTNSKTSLIVLLPAVAIAALFWHGLHQGRPFLAMTAALAAGCGALVPLPFAFLRPDAIFLALFGDPTFTGRTVIWRFVAGFAERHPWTGVGFGSLWNVGLNGPDMQQGYGVILQVAEGHNGYLDLAATTGYVGLVLGVAVLLWPFVRLFAQPAETLFRGPQAPAAALMTAYLASGIFHNLTESSLIRAAHPVWVLSLAAMMTIAFAGRSARRHGQALPGSNDPT